MSSTDHDRANPAGVTTLIFQVRGGPCSHFFVETAGSPGMEVPSASAEPYRVFMFDEGRMLGVFATRSGG